MNCRAVPSLSLARPIASVSLVCRRLLRREAQLWPSLSPCSPCSPCSPWFSLFFLQTEDLSRRRHQHRFAAFERRGAAARDFEDARHGFELVEERVDFGAAAGESDRAGRAFT